MTYQVLLKRTAEKELNDLPAQTRNRISARLSNLQNSPRPSRVKKLQGQEAYRLRVGDYRVLYTIDDKRRVVTV